MARSDTSDESLFPDFAGEPITLQVGECRFVTRPSPLTDQSPFLKNLLSGPEKRVQADGSYFIDADGTLFPYILRYLRTGALPIFFSSLNGHDHGMYNALLAEAQYLEILQLTNWLRNKEYEKAVRLEYTIQEFRGLDRGSSRLDRTCSSDEELKHYPAWKTKKVYVCPRGIDQHRGDPDSCGRMCKKAQGDKEPEFEDEVELQVLVISKKTIMNHMAPSQEPSNNPTTSSPLSGIGSTEYFAL